eukprot:evm.model.scf_403.1 EVM.evm.TU.scf_403.1   scf_403:5916-6932(-)
MFQQYHLPVPIDPLGGVPHHQELLQIPNTGGTRINGKNRSTDTTAFVGRTIPEGTGLGTVNSRQHKDQGAANLDVDFPGLVVTRESKALKLISPKTNAPIRTEKEGNPRTVHRIPHPARNGIPASPGRMGGPSIERGYEDCGAATGQALSHPARRQQVASVAGHSMGECSGPMSPTSGLPIGSKLRRWMVSPGPGSSAAGSVDSGVEGSDQATTEDVQSSTDMQPHSDVLASEPAGTADYGQPLVDCGTGRWSGCEQQSLRCGSHQQTDVHSAGPEGHHNVDVMQGTKEARGCEGLPMHTPKAKVGDAAFGGGHTVGSHASGIPRDSRLRMWMTGPEQ